jgi:hypothetical protein
MTVFLEANVYLDRRVGRSGRCCGDMDLHLLAALPQVSRRRYITVL